MESWYKNISKNCSVTFILQNFKNVKNNEKIQMDSKKSINSFEMKIMIIYLIIYETIIFFGNLLVTFRHYYYVKFVFYFFNMVNFFQIFVIQRSTEILIVLLAGSVHAKHSDIALDIFGIYFWVFEPLKPNLGLKFAIFENSRWIRIWQIGNFYFIFRFCGAKILKNKLKKKKNR